MYIALLTQLNEGCDYSIDCGKTWVKLKATTREEALIELKILIIGRPEEYTPETSDFYHDELEDELEDELGDYTLRQCTLLEVDSVEEIPIREWYKEAARILQTKKNESEEQKEREEYERLRRKYQR